MFDNKATMRHWASAALNFVGVCPLRASVTAGKTGGKNFQGQTGGVNHWVACAGTLGLLKEKVVYIDNV